MKEMTTMSNDKVLCLRTVDSNRRSYKEFQWPESGEVVAPDWDPKPECGNGLHGLLKGEGDASLLRDEADTIWQVVEVDSALCVNLDGKVKFPRCMVVFSGSKEGAIEMIEERHPDAAVVFGTATAGYFGTATAGYSGTATAGDFGTATAGYSGTATAGYFGTATAGDSGTATAGEFGCVSIRYWDGHRYRMTIGYTGEDGLEPNVRYRLDENHKLVKV
jgi:hypothetical protein